MAKKGKKQYSTSTTIRTTQTEPILGNHFTPIISVTKMENIDNNKCWWGYGATGTPMHSDGSANKYNHTQQLIVRYTSNRMCPYTHQEA